MKIRLTVRQYTLEAQGFLDELVPAFERYGIELVSANPDLEILLGKGTDTENRICWGELGKGASNRLLNRILGETKSRIWSLCGIMKEEAIARVSTLSVASLRVTVTEPKVGQIFLFAYALEETSYPDFEYECGRLLELFQEYVFSTGERTKAEYIVHELRSRGLKIATAESYTSGRVAAELTSVSGASEVFYSGFVPYTESAKNKYLSVDKKTLALDGAVSINAVYQMAVGTLKSTGADVVIATTGYAGPSGKDVGKCFVAVGDSKRIYIYEQHFVGSRSEITEMGVAQALDYTVRYLLGNLK